MSRIKQPSTWVGVASLLGVVVQLFTSHSLDAGLLSQALVSFGLITVNA